MKLIDLITVADQAYRKNFPESSLLEFVDDSGKPLDPPASGDTLALFIVREFAETFDENAPDVDQYGEAIRVMENAARDLTNIILDLGYAQYGAALDESIKRSKTSN